MRRQLRFERKKPRVSFLKKRLFWYGVILLFAAFLVFWVVVFSPWLEIQKIEVQGIQELQEQRVVSLVQEYFWSSFWGIPQNSIVLFESNMVQAQLARVFPVIDTVSIERSLPTTLVVKVLERTQAATWCPPATRAGKEDRCVALDKNGIAYGDTQKTEEFLIVSSRGEPVLGKELVGKSTLSTLLTFQDLIASFDIGSAGQVRGKSKEGWDMLVDLNEDITWQTIKLNAVLSEKVSPEKRGDLEYIDLRFGDQAYLKYR